MSDPLDEIQWKSPEFIQQRGLNTGNVLEYFALSPFYDRTSNNQALLMQFYFQDMSSRLKEMRGVEFVIAIAREPDFWIIRKQFRKSPTSTTPMQDYYIIGANVYQAPRVADILSLRLLASTLAITKANDLLSKMTQYSLESGGHSFMDPVKKEKERGTDRDVDRERDSGAGEPLIVVDSKDLKDISGKDGLQKDRFLGSVEIRSGGLQGDSKKPYSTPGTVASAAATNTGATLSNNNSTEVSRGAFDNLLSGIVNSSSDSSIYLDDIPLYGKGSTIEMLGLKIQEPQ